MPHERLRTTLILASIVAALPLVSRAQQPPPPEAAATAKTVANANNPLANMNAFNLQDYYDPSLYSIPNAVGNTMLLRGAIVAGHQIIRATLPVSTMGSLIGALSTWQHSFAGQKARSDANFFTCQPLGTFSIGGGYYIRSSAVWTFDETNERYLMPLGVGAGKVFKAGNAIGNAFIEPQFTVYHQGIGQPTMQIFAGINLQWSKRGK